MKHTRRVALVVALLCATGIAGVIIRMQVRSSVRLARGDRVWRLSYDLRFEAADGLQARIALPSNTDRARVFDQEIAYPGLAGRLRREPATRTQTLQLTSRTGGFFRVRCTFDVHVSPTAKWRHGAPGAVLSPEQRELFLQTEPDVSVAERLARIAGGRTGAALLEAIYADARDASRGDPAGWMVALCRDADIPARLVTGFDLAYSLDARPRKWVEAHVKDRWVPFDPAQGHARKLPASYLPVRFGGAAVVVARSATGVEDVYGVRRLRRPPGLVGPAGKHPIEILDLTRLPLATQRILGLILIVPLGALVTAILRNVIGLRTFGTFAPALLALSFVHADVMTGLVILSVVLMVGVYGRRLLDRLRLLMVARLGVLLTLIVLCSILCVSALHYFGWTRSFEAALLPMVILTLLVERAYITLEEDGGKVTLRLVGSTALVVLACYLLMRTRSVGRWILVYPETHLVTAGLLVAVGRYSGYRLTELWRFRDVVRGGAS